MSKKKKNKQKISKAQILQATRQSAERVETPVSTAGTFPSQVAPAFNSSPAQKLYGGQFEHVKTDMNFFIMIAVVYAILLAVAYYYNTQSGFVLELGNKLYQLLGI